jgi:hypothetical protein
MEVWRNKLFSKCRDVFQNTEYMMPRKSLKIKCPAPEIIK